MKERTRRSLKQPPRITSGRDASGFSEREIESERERGGGGGKRKSES